MVAFIGEEHAQAGSEPLTVSVPAGVANGDLLLASVWTYGGFNVNPPGGWTLLEDTGDIAFSLKAQMYYRVASSEPSQYTWHLSNGSDTFGVSISAFTDVESGAPHASAVKNFGTSAPKNNTGPSVATTKDCTIVTYQATYCNSGTISTHTSPDAGTEIVDWGHTAGSNAVSGALYYSDTQPAGSYAYEVDQTGSVYCYGMFTVALAGGGIPATFHAAAPLPAVADLAGTVIMPATVHGTAYVPSFGAAGEVIPEYIRVQAPAASASGEAVVTMPALLRPAVPAATASLDGFRDMFATLRATAPRAQTFISLENRVSGARVITVIGESRTLKV